MSEIIQTIYIENCISDNIIEFECYNSSISEPLPTKGAIDLICSSMGKSLDHNTKLGKPSAPNDLICSSLENPVEQTLSVESKDNQFVYEIDKYNQCVVNEIREYKYRLHNLNNINKIIAKYIDNMSNMSNKKQISRKYGNISIIIGGMFASKTTELIRLAERQVLAKRSVLYIKSNKDKRAISITTHSGRSVSSFISVDTLSEVDVSDYHCVAVDEGQFFPDIDKYPDQWANDGIVVIISALSGDYKRENFGNIHKLIPKAEYVIKLSAVCGVCGDDAHFSKKIDANNDSQVDIGSEDKYIPVCRKCYQEDINMCLLIINNDQIDIHNQLKHINYDEGKRL